ncbi:CRISPR-associated protein Cas4 [Candidatus Marsarchaeota G1 archaeon OSP_D]|jgi:CRISPR-associated exonuclease Cas4|uniref:CRISPR-associated exonuclease Cas4 n=2 Tax=Candidatus Marsarchaeota group 1 TaxID=2203770 RepID=A0A2R6A9G5_9ARCH|nr:MAG: CRISPR-associated protein Cas4 [Candidatus Marsarchaeota G1 archaeon OSP_D]PSN87895.1 MAG: CRISPR-associated protein Cas4 [Candidatus Marsarchaeota G1 archaeon OSP_C]
MEENKELVSVTAVRQYFYCKREPYYIYVVHLQEPPTETMEAGREAHLEDPFQAFLRKLNPKFMFRSPALKSDKLGIAGTPDYVFVTKFDEIVPAEVKRSPHTQGKKGLQFVAQLVAYALILEEGYVLKDGELVETQDVTKTVVKRGVIYSAIQKKVDVLQITEELKRAVRRGIQDLKSIIETGEFPSVRQPWSKCANCWYRRYCYP